MNAELSGWTVIRCLDLAANVGFFVDNLGFRIVLVTPADDPKRFVVERDNVVVSLEVGAVDEPGHFVIIAPAPHGPVQLVYTAPGGSTVRFEQMWSEVTIPDSVPSLTVTAATGGDFGIGRAGMGYRDLLPDRWGGRFIASHIRIDEGGDVADWVHFHRIRFQMIFVAAGWVDVVYEDQGEPFRMYAGDCVLQPPEIRHRVLRSSAGLEVIEIGCPAEHDTLADHDLDLPTAQLVPDRDFGGQRFVRHVAGSASVEPWLVDGLLCRDTGIAAATGGLAAAVVISSSSQGPVANDALTNRGEFILCVGLAGDATIDIEGHGPVDVAPRTSVALPPDSAWRFTDVSENHELLLVTLPTDAITLA